MLLCVVWSVSTWMCYTAQYTYTVRRPKLPWNCVTKHAWSLQKAPWIYYEFDFDLIFCLCTLRNHLLLTGLSITPWGCHLTIAGDAVRELSLTLAHLIQGPGWFLSPLVTSSCVPPQLPHPVILELVWPSTWFYCVLLSLRDELTLFSHGSDWCWREHCGSFHMKIILLSYLMCWGAPGEVNCSLHCLLTGLLDISPSNKKNPDSPLTTRHSIWRCDWTSLLVHPSAFLLLVDSVLHGLKNCIFERLCTVI